MGKKQRPSTRKERKAKTPATVSTRFKPLFWDDADQRQTVIKEIKRRYETLKADVGADSYQKDLLIQRAIFISLKLETMEVEAASTGQFDFGVYTQAVNALSGLLTKLGLEKAVKDAGDLRDYVQRNGSRK